MEIPFALFLSSTSEFKLFPSADCWCNELVESIFRGTCQCERFVAKIARLFIIWWNIFRWSESGHYSMPDILKPGKKKKINQHRLCLWGVTGKPKFDSASRESRSRIAFFWGFEKHNNLVSSQRIPCPLVLWAKFPRRTIQFGWQASTSI